MGQNTPCWKRFHSDKMHGSSVERVHRMVRNKLHVIKGDITQLQMDAIVNAANSHLLGGGGVDGAIHRAAGPLLASECRKLGGCKTGNAKITKGYNLPAKYVIHAVGPIWRGGGKGEPKLLASCYLSSLKLADKHKLKTIAFPAISCGIFGYPVSQAAVIAVNETAKFLELHDTIADVYFVCFDDAIYESYQHALDSLNHE